MIHSSDLTSPSESDCTRIKTALLQSHEQVMVWPTAKSRYRLPNPNIETPYPIHGFGFEGLLYLGSND